MRLLNLVTLFLLAISWQNSAFSQSYQCKRQNGTTYQSPNACPSPGLIYYGPTESPNTSYRSENSRIQAAGEELQYLSSECSRLSEGIRTAPARGLKYDVIQASQKEFTEKCSDELSAARQQVYASKRDKKSNALEEKKSSQMKVVMNKEEEARKYRQCAEIRNALNNRKAKTNMTEGEKNDILAFEQRYRDRCY